MIGYRIAHWGEMGRSAKICDPPAIRHIESAFPIVIGFVLL